MARQLPARIGEAPASPAPRASGTAKAGALVVGVLSLAAAASALWRRPAPAQTAGAEQVLYFLSLAGCPACAEVAPVVAAFEAEHPDVRVERVDAGHSSLPPLMAPAVLTRSAGEWRLAEGAGDWFASPGALNNWLRGA